MLLMSAAFVLGGALFAHGQTNTFRYQGSLTDGGNPAAGAFQMQFKLFDAASGGVQQGSTLTDLPVTVTRRASAVGRGFVGVVQNNGGNYLRLSATYKNVTSGQTTTVDVEVAQNAAVDLGWLEKCPLATGDTLTLSHPNFKARTWEF